MSGFWFIIEGNLHDFYGFTYMCSLNAIAGVIGTSFLI